METSSGYKLKALRSYNGGEYTLCEFEDYLETKEFDMSAQYQKLLSRMELLKESIEH